MAVSGVAGLGSGATWGSALAAGATATASVSGAGIGATGASGLGAVAVSVAGALFGIRAGNRPLITVAGASTAAVLAAGLVLRRRAITAPSRAPLRR